MEEGEIIADEAHAVGRHNASPSFISQAAHEPALDPSGTTHSPALEWPGDARPAPELPSVVDAPVCHGNAGLPSPPSSLRLLVLRSTVLRRPQKLALLDGYSEIQIGRDALPPGSDTPKIRLKELEVSKLHATVYWDQERSQWSVVDMGSKHGTFVQPAASASHSVVPTAGTSTQGADARGLRLSPSRVASMPRTLHHLDRLTIGGSTFIIHLHEGGVPCAECSPQPDEEIPLFSHGSVNGDSTKKRKLDSSPTMTAGAVGVVQSRNPKQALAMLKKSLLSTVAPSSATASGSQTPQYVDRSARRRALHPDHSSARTSGSERSRNSSPGIPAVPATPQPPTPVSAPSTPLPSSNIGHRLLMKQGWQPGSALGDPSNERDGIVAPLEPPSTVGRAGLGASARAPNSALAAQDGDWRDAGKKRRWAELDRDGVA